MMKKNQNTALLITMIWVALHVWFALDRSIDVDESAKYSYTFMPFSDALYQHMSEFAPYHPGEFMLGYCSKMLFGSVLPDHLWARLPALFFGALTIYFTSSLGNWFLIIGLFFSTALTSFATEFLSYTQLIFSGLVVLRLIFWPAKREENFFFIINLFFGHLYGICGVGLAYLFRRDWLKVALCGLTVVGVLAVHLVIRRSHVPLNAPLPPLIEIARQSLGVLSNPHKALYLFSPLFLLGLFSKLRHEPVRALQLLFVMFCVGMVPTFAAAAKGYPFLPRQVVGVLVPFLAFVAFGFEAIVKRANRYVATFLLITCIIISGQAWLKFIVGIPPFVDQPMRKLHRVVQVLRLPQYRNVLWFDPVTSGAAEKYLDKSLGIADKTTYRYSVKNDTIRKNCWRRADAQPLCIFASEDTQFVWQGDSASVKSKIEELILVAGKGEKIDSLVHSIYILPAIDSTLSVIRTW